MLPIRIAIVSVLAALLCAACTTSPPPGRTAELGTTAPSVRLPVASDEPAVALLGPASRRALGQSPIPMLVLPVEYADRTTVMAGEHWCALSYRDDELTISVHATNLWHDQLGREELEEIPPPTGSVRGQPALETVNEAIRSVAWNERDVAFALEVECARPFEDTRCTERDFVIELAERLVPAHRGQEVAR